VTGKNKPILDEQSFEKLLEAAHVMQEHTRKTQELQEPPDVQSVPEPEVPQKSPPQTSKPASGESSPANVDYTATLAEIADTQQRIRVKHLEADKAMALVVERVVRITNASGAAVAIVEDKTVRYRAGGGTPALPVGSEVPLRAAVCQATVRTGQVLGASDVKVEILFDPDPCLARGILSLLAVPIYQTGEIAGALELYFDRPQGFTEQDIHTCQLMAGLVTEVLGRDAESNLKKSMAAERSTMLAAIEKLKPNLAALVKEKPAAASPAKLAPESAASKEFPCWKCGNSLLAEEQFCGKCGTPRAGGDILPSLQSKVASLWHMQQARQNSSPPAIETPPAEDAEGWAELHLEKIPLDEKHLDEEHPGGEPHLDEVHLDEDHLDQPRLNETHAELSGDKPAHDPPEPLFSPPLENDPMLAGLDYSSFDEEILVPPLSSNMEDGEVVEEGRTTALAKSQPVDLVWSSAAKARDFLESLSGARRPGTFTHFWRARRGDFYLGIALILVVVVIRWGIWSDHPVGASGNGVTVSGRAIRRRAPAPDADLSVFDKLLISLGLAEAPDAPEYRGNPDTQVWVDLHTALYYCPGSDLYGKTAKGKMSSQRDAQLDQFEPAYRKACE